MKTYREVEDMEKTVYINQTMYDELVKNSHVTHEHGNIFTDFWGDKRQVVITEVIKPVVEVKDGRE